MFLAGGIVALAINSLLTTQGNLSKEIQEVKTPVKELSEKYEAQIKEIGAVRTDIASVEGEVKTTRTELAAKIENIAGKIDALERRMEKDNLLVAPTSTATAPVNPTSTIAPTQTPMGWIQWDIPPTSTRPPIP